MAGYRQPGGGYEYINVTADITLGVNDAGKFFNNRGATGAVTITLPDAASFGAGNWVLVGSAADQNLTVNCSPADKLIIDNDLAADSVALSTSSHKIGGMFKFVSDGTGWQVGNMTFSGQTVSTAT
ncbi:MAG: hypothetical protein EBR82_27875 [Caulobacteraceae bacterium]|nr:hypothetical protein [Caulobacteraceae bacterium]